MFQQV